MKILLLEIQFFMELHLENCMQQDNQERERDHNVPPNPTIRLFFLISWNVKIEAHPEQKMAPYSYRRHI